ncbi:MAG: Glycosyltransferase [Microgenomates group bacterium Gr01-1014_5]|nr:MAG: Glycosyltransferase [Microgenomates group bacterium Gr01-1014_5]
MFRIKVLTIGLASLFFILGLATLSDYGVNWDAMSHLQRGQAYLHYYLTGRNDYSDLREWNLYREKVEEVKTRTAGDVLPRNRLYLQDTGTIFFSPDIPKSEVPRISLYQNTGADLNYIMTHYDYGHPHVSDVLSSVFNFVLFQKLGLINDVDSYRVYGILLAASLVGLVFWWTASSYGKFAGVVAALALSAYPLFWAESHFNTEKDIPETVYWSFMLFAVWRGITGKSWKWVLASGVFFGLAIGTKFNVLFSLFVIVPWLVVYLLPKWNPSEFFKKQRKLFLSLIIAPLLGLSLYIGTWPYFWENTTGKVKQVISFYKTIGTANNVDPSFLGPLGINTYAFQWILYTTPLVILFFAVLGVVFALFRIKKEKDKQSLLFLLWLIVPVVRVSWPGANIYGGVRQIMEFIPAMAILAGIGASQTVVWVHGYIVEFKQFNKLTSKPLRVLALLLFLPLVFKLIEIHPNENTYFNPLIGGLKGAAERGFPAWGVSFGAPYREAIEWVNKNTELGAKLTLGSEILGNIPGVFIRPDIDYKSNRSGYLRQGEYVISLRFDGTENRSYFDMYLDRMLEPVHEITVDGVPILKIWKNDEQHLKAEWKNEGVVEGLKYTSEKSGLLFDIERVEKLSRLELAYDESNCPEIEYAYLEVSKDGESWERIPGVLPEETRIRVVAKQPSAGKFVEPFVGQEARYIHLVLSPTNTCLAQVKSSVLYYFK